MILLRQKLYSHTYKNITDPEKRAEKARELLRRSEELNNEFNLQKRIDEINAKYLEDLRKSAQGKPISGAGTKDAKFADAAELKGRRDKAIANARAYWNTAYEDFTEGVSRKGEAEELAKAKKEEAERLAAESKKRSKKLGKFIKSTQGKVILGTTAGLAIAGGTAYEISKAQKKKMAREEAEEIRKKVRGYDSPKKK